MSNKVFEEAPQTPQPSGGAADKVRKAARQLAYDTRYKVKSKFKDGQKADPASLKRAYMQQLGSSSAPGPVKALAKKMLIGEEYDFTDVESSLSRIYTKVFVEGGGKKVEEIEIVEESSDTKYTIRVKDKKTGREYLRKADRAKISELRSNPNISSVEITGRKEADTYDKTGGKEKKADKDYDGDGKIESGTAEYMGSKDKAIKKSMAKEETLHEDEYRKMLAKERKTEKEKESKRGGVRSITPGKHADSIAKNYADQERKSINYMDKKTKNNKVIVGMAKEEVIYEKDEEGDKKIDVMKKGKNNIKINPSLGESIRAELDLLKAQKIAEQDASMKQQEDEKKKEQLAAQQGKKDKMMKMRILQNKMRAVRGGAEISASHKLEGDTIAEGEGTMRYCPACDKDETRDECKAGGEYWDENSKPAKEEDSRSMPAKINLAKNKLRAMGIKMSYDMKGEQIDEVMTPKEKGESERSRSSSTLEMGRRTKDAYHKVRGAMIAAKQLKKDAEELKNEATEDSLKDRRMERGGVGGNIRYDKAPKPTNTAGKKKPYDGMSALEKVKASIRAKHGKGAIYEPKKD